MEVLSRAYLQKHKLSFESHVPTGWSASVCVLLCAVEADTEEYTFNKDCL